MGQGGAGPAAGPGLGGDAEGRDAGAAHRHRPVLHLQAVLALLAAAPLTLQEAPGLQDGPGVVVVVLHHRTVLQHHDAALTQALGLHVGGGEVVVVGDPSGPQGERTQ